MLNPVVNGMWDGNVAIDGLLIAASLLVGIALLWEAAALTVAHVSGGVIWRLTLSELVMRQPALGLVFLLGCCAILGGLAVHWLDVVRSAL